ncbi:MAG: hypothetical protein U0670_07765 [Anaerolineae bacterium]
MNPSITAPDPAVIKAQAALFNGERAEVRRYLSEYADAGGDTSLSVIRWLDAQTAETPEERIDKLREMVGEGSTDSDPYVQLAAQTLQIEDRIRAVITPDGGRRMLTVLIALALIVGGAALGGTIALAISRANASTEIAQTTDQTAVETVPAVAPTATPIDRSVGLPPDSGYMTQYAAGLLRLIAIEEDSQRVVDASGAALTPIPGARFVALGFQFECRAGLCNDPPEGRVELRGNKAFFTAPREDAFISGGRVWEAVARDRVTGGWLVFEVPVDTAIEEIAVYPTGGDANGPPYVIHLAG